MPTRRQLPAALAATLPALPAAAQEMTPEQRAEHDAILGQLAPARGPEDLAFLVYPGCTALDVIGPHHMLSGLMGARLRLVAKSRAPIVTDTGVTLTPDTSFAECPERLTLVCVPGGTAGTLAAMADAETIAFLATRGAAAGWVTGVCTGTLLLGAAGLLRGRRATSHWVTRDLLAAFGAIPEDARIVVDGNRVTGGGVTAGLDFGLSMVAALRDDDYARAVQLVAEYDPAPPFDAGSPARAPAETTRLMRALFAPFHDQARVAVQAAAARMP